MHEDIIPAQLVMQIMRNWYLANTPDLPSGGRWDQVQQADGSMLFRFTPMAELEDEHKKRALELWNQSLISREDALKMLPAPRRYEPWEVS